MKIQLNEATQNWNKVVSAHFDRALFLFSDDTERRRNEYMERMTKSLGKLKQALDIQDRTMIIEEAAGAQANFIKLYYLFGESEVI
jgi:hypothetical protein